MSGVFLRALVPVLLLGLLAPTDSHALGGRRRRNNSYNYYVPQVPQQQVPQVVRQVEVVDGYTVSAEYKKNPDGSLSDRRVYAVMNNRGWWNMIPQGQTWEPPKATTPTPTPTPKPTPSVPTETAPPRIATPKVQTGQPKATVDPKQTSTQAWEKYHQDMEAYAKASREQMEKKLGTQYTQNTVNAVNRYPTLYARVQSSVAPVRATSLDNLMDFAGLGKQGNVHGLPVDGQVKPYREAGSGAKPSIVVFAGKKNAHEVQRSVEDFSAVYETEAARKIAGNAAGDLWTGDWRGALKKATGGKDAFTPGISVIVDASEDLKNGYGKYIQGLASGRLIAASKGIEGAEKLKGSRKLSRGENIAATGRRLGSRRVADGVGEIAGRVNARLGEVEQGANKIFIASVQESMHDAFGAIHKGIGTRTEDYSLSLVYDPKKAAQLNKLKGDSDFLLAIPMKDGGTHYVGVGGKTPKELAAKMLAEITNASKDGPLDAETIAKLEEKAKASYEREQKLVIAEEAKERQQAEAGEKTEAGEGEAEAPVKADGDPNPPAAGADPDSKTSGIRPDASDAQVAQAEATIEADAIAREAAEQLDITLKSTHSATILRADTESDE